MMEVNRNTSDNFSKLFDISPDDLQTKSDVSLEGENKKSEFYDVEGEGRYLEDASPNESMIKKHVSVGDSLPYGPRLYYESPDTVVRMREIGEGNRIILLGVLGAFTPYCWNRHLFRVLKKLRYYEERGIDYICCVSTNDAYVQSAYAKYLGCEETVLMLADATARFTKAMGMDVVLPWLDNKIRSKRYVLLAEDMVITKMIVAPCDNAKLKWQCDHINQEEEVDEEESDDSWI